MLAYLWVAIGGALGSVARFWMSGAVASRVGETFPWGTILVNVTGSLAIGFLAALVVPEGRWSMALGARQFMMMGVCGGFTTFSTFSLETLKLMQDREWLHAGGNVVLSVFLCLLGVWLGNLLGATLNSR
jgi:CrcB protein